MKPPDGIDGKFSVKKMRGNVATHGDAFPLFDWGVVEWEERKGMEVVEGSGGTL
jgi:hypothetical protein